ncbi:MAG: phosphohistidine phosphatase SixA [Pseudomonadota bacterium]|nr:phosphohistidine phosphatase SixA [Pseudomonadota bacterium]
MALYLMRHGDFIPPEIDPDCPLSERGVAEATKAARLAAERGARTFRILHSDRTRAVQTASLCAEILRPAGGCGEMAGLHPHDDIFAVLDAIEGAEDVMIVGHLPFLESLAAYLVTGTLGKAAASFPTAAIVCLEREPERKGWKIAWEIKP